VNVQDYMLLELTFGFHKVV